MPPGLGGFRKSVRRRIGYGIRKIALNQQAPYGVSRRAHCWPAGLARPQGGFEHGIVAVASTMVQANGVGQQPVTTTYEVDLLREAAGWRVAAFEAEP